MLDKKEWTLLHSEWDDDDYRDYKYLLSRVDPEAYHKFLKERIHSHLVEDEFHILYYGDFDKDFHWDLAEHEGYVEILYTTLNSVAVKILKSSVDEKMRMLRKHSLEKQLDEVRDQMFSLPGLVWENEYLVDEEATSKVCPEYFVLDEEYRILATELTCIIRSLNKGTN